MSSLAAVGHEHHRRLNEQLDLIPGLADALSLRPVPEGFAPRFLELGAFISETLRPHMQAIERRVYPELDRLMQSRHSMAQMRREHRDLEDLCASLETYRAAILDGSLDAARAGGLRRVLYRLYALLKVHLAEEEEYLRVLEHNLTESEQALLIRRIEEAEGRPL